MLILHLNCKEKLSPPLFTGLQVLNVLHCVTASRYTSKEGAVYAISLEWPAKGMQMRGFVTTREHVKSGNHIHLNCVSIAQILFSLVFYSGLTEAKSLFVFSFNIIILRACLTLPLQGEVGL